MLPEYPVREVASGSRSTWPASGRWKYRAEEVWAATGAERFFAKTDPGQVVVDEVAGQLLAFVALPDASWKWLAAGFVLFRAFDILKPFPARRAERLPGGWGIMTDDVAAGAYSAVFLLVLGQLIR